MKMKKALVFLTACMLAVSCCQKSDISSGELTTQELTYTYNEGKIEVELKVEYPDGGNEFLKQAVREYISETLGGKYNGSLEEGQGMIDFYGEQIKASLLKEYEEVKQDLEEENINGFLTKMNIKKDYETNKLVTFTVAQEFYLNGAHGSAMCFGMTFRKSDGRRFTPDMMVDIHSDGMYTILKEGIREYFSETDGKPLDDSALQEYIISDNNIESLPMPQFPPFVTKQGLSFIYQQYEISYYAAGMPSFIVGLDKIKPFLTKPALDMLEITEE